VILYSAGGVVGTMHHLHFPGTPVEHMALGAFFSATEVIPLTFLTVEAWTFRQLGSRQERRSVGGPTALTANHGHAAMMGVYGMLAVGLAMSALRYLVPAQYWSDKLARICFWSLNTGLAWMVFVTLLPLGVLQLYASVNQGYFEARSLGYLTTPGNQLLDWGRMPGDLIFIIGGTLPFLWIAWLGVAVADCPVRDACTSSPHGREVTRELDPSPHSDAGRFHRGLACCVAGIGLFLPLGMLASRPAPPDLLALLATVAVVAAAALPLAR
jgi:nitric oxide reductase large subunit